MVNEYIQPISSNTDNSISGEKGDSNRRRFIKSLFYVFLLFLITSVTCVWYAKTLNQPPTDFPLNQPIAIENGMSIKSITEKLQDAKVVRSSTFLYYTLVFFHDPSSVKASTYIFNSPLSTNDVARRLSEGDFDTDLVRFTHIEGERVTAIATRAADILPAFNTERFIKNATPLEGKLFPETYFIPITYTDDDLLHLLTKAYVAAIAPYEHLIASSTLSIDEILVLASIIEREANTTESKKMVSSILQNRLAIDMPLQADASIEYILSKPLSELTPQDLEIDSPYNTYLYSGLPPTPIGNPGLEAILAVLEPTPSDYFYYITDHDGVFHYAKTYTEHLSNIERYLR